MTLQTELAKLIRNSIIDTPKDSEGTASYSEISERVAQAILDSGLVVAVTEESRFPHALCAIEGCLRYGQQIDQWLPVESAPKDANRSVLSTEGSGIITATLRTAKPVMSDGGTSEIDDSKRRVICG